MQRDNTIDALKFFLIFFVVLGHSIPRFGGGNLDYLESSIYLFHMPLFVMLSGYLYNKQPTRKFWKGEFALLASLMMFELINGVLNYLFRHTIIPLFQPYWTLWYLLSLIYWRLIVQYIPSKWLNHRCIVMCVSIALALLTPFLPIGYIVSFQRTFTFLPFFLMGYYIRQSNSLSKIRSVSIWKSIGVIGVCLFVCCLFIFVGMPVMQILRGADSYRECYLPIMFAISLKGILLVTSLLISLALLSVFRTSNERIAREGRNGLSYYLYHAPIIEFMMMPLSEWCSLEHSTVLVIIFTICNLLVCSILSRFQMSQYITNPLTLVKYKTI